MRLSYDQIHIISGYLKDKPVIKAYVFGSYARGDANEKSDIDLLIDWDYSQNIGWNYVSYWRELKEKLHKNVDFVSVRWIDPLIEQQVNRDKQLIYERRVG